MTSIDITSIVVAIINVIGTIIVYLSNKQVSKMKNLKIEVDQEIKDMGDKLQKQINESIIATDNINIGNIRSRIVTFDSLVRKDKDHCKIQRYQYDAIFKDINEWRDFHIKYPGLNGEINIAIENIEESFKEANFDEK